MNKIEKVDTHSQATAHGFATLFKSLLLLCVGALLALGGFGYIYLPLEGVPPAIRQPVGWLLGWGFFLWGSMLFVHALRGLLNRRRIQRISERHFNEPWFMDFTWNPHGMRDPAGRRAFGSVVKAVLFGVFLTPFNLLLTTDLPDPWIAWIMVGVVDLFMILRVAVALYQLAQFLKFGYARLSFRSFPYHPGDKLVVGLSGTPKDHLKATLRFVEERYETSGTGNNRVTLLECYQHYDEEKELPSPTGDLPLVKHKKEGGFESEFEIDFDLPDKAEWITELSGTPVRYWELVVESEQPGIDYRTTFPLPV